MPTTISSANSPSAEPTADSPPPLAPRMLAISAMPTGSFAPDSPSSRVPLRPAISLSPRTENTTAGSVGASAVPSSRAVRQSRPKSVCPSSASAPAVTAVPRTPTQTIAPAAVRNRRSPMLMPPSNRMITNATVTRRWSVTIPRPPSDGHRSEATAAASRKIAGAGMRTSALIRFDSSAADRASDTRAMTTPKACTSPIARPPAGRSGRPDLRRRDVRLPGALPRTWSRRAAARGPARVRPPAVRVGPARVHPPAGRGRAGRSPCRG